MAPRREALKVAGRRIRTALVLVTLAGAARAQFDAYTWDFKHGSYGGGQTWVSGDQLDIQLMPQCAFGDSDSGWAKTTAPETGRFTFDYTATSYACPALGGYCSNAMLLTVTGPSSCDLSPWSAPPECEHIQALFNDGDPFFASAGHVPLDGKWVVDVVAGDMFQVAAATWGFTLDCQILATFTNLAFTPALVSSQDQLSLSAGGSVKLDITAPAKLVGEPYLVLGSASGTQPGIPVDGWVLPLNSDVYLMHTLSNPNGPPISAGFGILDGHGLASARFDLVSGTNPSLAGTQLHHAAVAFDLTSAQSPFVGLVSAAVPLLLVP